LFFAATTNGDYVRPEAYRDTKDVLSFLFYLRQSDTSSADRCPAFNVVALPRQLARW